MPFSEVAPIGELNEEKEGQETAGVDNDYGCVFCLTGREYSVAQRLEKAVPGLKAISPVKLRYRRINGVAHEESVILFPGYVFFEVKSGSNVEIRTINNEQDVIKVLYVDEENNEWRLVNSDREITKRFFNMNGVVGFSQAFFDEGDKIHIVRGFLKEYEGKIQRVNRRAKTVQISLTIGNKNATVWLGYEEIAR